MERLRGPARTAVGVILIGQAALLGIKTAEALSSDDRNPNELIFQQALRETTQVVDEDTNELGEFSNFEIVNGAFLNVLAVGGLASAGVRQFRRGNQIRREVNAAAEQQRHENIHGQ